MSSLSDSSILAGGSGVSESVYQIDQSIRFDQNANASMSRTPSSASSRTTWTFSWWWKRGNMSGSTNGTNQRQPIFGTTAFSILSNHNSTQIDGINVVYTGSANDIQTTEKYRDVSAWYHFVFVLDTTNSVTSERVRLYKNGERITNFASISYPSKDTTYTVNNTQAHYIGLRNSGENLDGYLAEINFVDGYAYGPEYFGEFNSSNIWIPKEYTGSYGTNGFKIDGRDSSDLGDDESGNGNDFTVSGLAAHDQVADSPTNNFCTLNPIYRGTGSQYGVQENGNLELKFSGSQNAGQVCTQLFTTGKWYWEMRVKAGGGSANYFLSSGIAAVNDGYVKSDTNMHGTVTGEIGVNSYDGKVRFANSVTKTYTEVPFADGDILQVAVDADNGAIYYGKNGTFMGSGDPASGASKTNAGATWTPASYSGGWVPTAGALGGSVPIVTMNFGQEGTFSGGTTAGGNSDGNGVGNFKYSVPSGYLALCTKGLGS